MRKIVEVNQTVLVDSCDLCGSHLSRMYRCEGCGIDLCATCTEFLDETPVYGRLTNDVTIGLCPHCAQLLDAITPQANSLRKQQDRLHKKWSRECVEGLLQRRARKATTDGQDKNQTA